MSALAHAPTEPIQMHPERTDDPATLRWVVPIGTVAFTGPVAWAPGPLGDHLQAGEVQVRSVPAGVLVTLAEGLTWRRDGSAIRTALAAALRRPTQWVLSQDRDPDGSQADLDEQLRQRMCEAIAGPPGEYVRSHGGNVELVDVADGCVTVRLSGTCGHCPAAAFTLHRHFEQELRRDCPGIVSVNLAP